MSFFDDFKGIGDGFEKLAGLYLEHEKIKSGQVSQNAVAEQDQLIRFPSNIDQRVNVSPVPPEQLRTQQVGGAVPLQVGGLSIDKNWLIAGGALLAGVILLKMVK